MEIFCTKQQTEWIFSHSKTFHHQKSVKNDKIFTEKQMVKTREKSLHGFREEDTTVAYGRDWGFAGCNAVIFADKEDFEKKAKVQFYADYLYLFENGKWFVKGTGVSSWIELAAVVGMMA